MNNDEKLFIIILFYNLYLLTLTYVLYCNYYIIRINHLYNDIILYSAFLISMNMYYQLINSQSIDLD
jgi:hypothetical protein